MSLRDKVIAAYEASDLKKQDMTRKKALIDEIAHFFNRLAVVSLQVNDNPFTIEGIVFYASELRMASGELYGYQVDASRKCAACQQYIELMVSERFIENGRLRDTVEFDVGPAEFGRWLLEPHLCEFSIDQRKPIQGFGRTEDPG